MSHNQGNRPSTPNPIHGAASVGVLILVIIRFLGDLASCAGPARYADDVFRPVSHVDDVIRPASQIDNLPSGAFPNNPSQNPIDDLSPQQRPNSESGLDEVVPGPISQVDEEADPFAFIRNVEAENIVNLHDTWTPINNSEIIQKTALAKIRLSQQYPISNMGVFAILPQTDSGFTNIFKTPMSNYHQKEMIKYAELFQALPNSQVASLDNTGPEQLFQAIRQHGDGGPLIIVGHSESATSERVLIMPDGSMVLVAEVHEVCIEAGTTCLILTCYSDDFGLTNEIDLEETFLMTRRGYDIMSLLQANDPSIPRAVTLALASEQISETDIVIKAMRYERTVLKASKLTVAGIVGTTGVTYVVTSKFQDPREK